jgi:hypothetical protein
VTRDPERANARDAAAWVDRARAGDLDAAWKLSDRIRARRVGPRDGTLPRHFQQIWDGSAFDGRRVLIRCYHGLGDTIQFIRYAALVRARAAEVIVWAQPALLPILATAAGIDRLLPLHDGAPDVGYDLDVEVMELPYAFRSTWATLPAAVPYLAAAPLTLPNAGRPRVGLAWRGGGWNGARSIAFPDLAPLLEMTGISWFSLQADVREGETHDNLRAPDVRTILRTAECMRAMDLVISIDSMAAHLAGALAVPAWTLLPREADWRWMTQRSDSPWYPTMTLLRQRLEGDWTGVVAEVMQRLSSCFLR